MGEDCALGHVAKGPLSNSRLDCARLRTTLALKNAEIAEDTKLPIPTTSHM